MSERMRVVQAFFLIGLGMILGSGVNIFPYGSPGHEILGELVYILQDFRVLLLMIFGVGLFFTELGMSDESIHIHLDAPEQ